MSSQSAIDMGRSRACNCIGPQNGQPRCPCMMEGIIQRDGKWVQQERIVGDVIPSFTPPRAQGCICPAGAEKTCSGPLCPRRAIVGTTARLSATQGRE